MSRDSNQAVYFQCQLCGDCCSSWNIPMEADKAERLLQKPWVQDRLADTRRELVRVSDELYRLPLTDENTCVFLAEDRRCLIEVHEGLALKPHECQRFPFATVRLPDGTAVHDTSAACKSISEKLLLAFQPIQPRPVQPLAVSDALPPAPDVGLEAVGQFPQQVWLTWRKSTDWQTYLRLQAEWASWFQDNQISATDALSRVDASLSEQAAHQPGYLKSGWSNRLLTLCFLRKPYRTLSAWSLLRGQEYHDPRLFGEPLDLRLHQQVRWNPQQERLLKAFVFNLLGRKRLLSVGGSAQALVAMVGIAILLVRWYAQALAAFLGESEPTEKEVATAIRLVERYYTGHQPRFFDFFTSRFKGWLIASMLRL